MARRNIEIPNLYEDLLGAGDVSSADYSSAFTTMNPQVSAAPTTTSGGGGGYVSPPPGPGGGGGGAGGGGTSGMPTADDLLKKIDEQTDRIDDLETAVQDLQGEKTALISYAAFLGGALAVTTGAWQWYTPCGFVLRDVRAEVDTAPLNQSVILDVNVDGTTIFATAANRPIIAAGALVSSTTLPDTVAVEQGSSITLDIDQVGTGTVGSNLSVVILGYTRRS